MAPDASAAVGPRGTVLRLGVKPRTNRERGLPKPAATEMWIDAAGARGDYNRWRQEQHAGDPNMALLLLPVEILHQLQREGWPVEPGDLGENLTTEGIPYGAYRPGRRFRIGADVEIAVSRACEPCRNLFLLPYVGVAVGPRFLRVVSGRRGWYARVLRTGCVRPGDPVEALPDPA